MGGSNDGLNQLIEDGDDDPTDLDGNARVQDSNDDDPVTASWDLASSVFLNAGSNTVILSEADYNGPQPKTFFRIQTLPILE